MPALTFLDRSLEGDWCHIVQGHLKFLGCFSVVWIHIQVGRALIEYAKSKLPIIQSNLKITICLLVSKFG